MRTAVIGLGYFSQFHLDAWTTLPGVQVTGVTDLDPTRRDWAMQRYGVRAYPDTARMLDAAQPDVVDIIAPPSAHADLIAQCATAGRVIVCQKPFCTSLDEAEHTTALAEAAGARLVIHENFRFQPWHRAIKSALPELGDIYQARFALRPGDGRGPDAYLSRQPRFRSIKRLLIEETAVHLIDLFRWFMGDITAVYADLRQINPVIAGEDAGLMILDHASGARSTFDGNRHSDHISDSPRRTMGLMEIEGEGGAITLDGQGQVLLRPFGSQTPRIIPVLFPASSNS
ncbi:MAG: Gfo/Idh/MocA family protein [Paracoccaceae bacterium]